MVITMNNRHIRAKPILLNNGLILVSLSKAKAAIRQKPIEGRNVKRSDISEPMRKKRFENKESVMI
jgi:hypothetical protein